MRKSFKIATYLLSVSVLSAIGIWLCKSVIWLQCYIDVDLCTNILLGISTNALFASIGFWINYFDKKQELKEDLLIVYRTIRQRCFERLFYEANSYDNDTNEVSQIYDYLNQNRKLCFDYRPPFLLMKIKALKLFDKFRYLFKKKNLSSNNSVTNKYISEDPYALICSLYGQLSFYFSYLHILQVSMDEYDRIIELCNKKLSQNDEGNRNLSEYKSYLEITKKQKLLAERRLESRFCFETKYSQDLMDKKDWFSKFYAIDLHLNDNQFSDYSSYYLLPEECIIEDSVKPYDEITTYDIPLQ